MLNYLNLKLSNLNFLIKNSALQNNDKTEFLQNFQKY